MGLFNIIGVMRNFKNSKNNNLCYFLISYKYIMLILEI